MNPSNIKTAADALKVRNAYLANLDAQIKNLDKTKNATTIFAQTGQTPLAPQDTRSISEKFADVERLRVDLRKRLLSLTDGREAGNIMATLSADEVQAASLVLDDIIKQLKPKYSLGVPAPIFVEFLRRYIADYNKTVGFVSNLRPDLQDQYDQSEVLQATSQYMQDQLQEDESQKQASAFAKDQMNAERDAILAEEMEREQFNTLVASVKREEVDEVADLMAAKYVKRIVPTGRKILNPETGRMVSEREQRLVRVYEPPSDLMRNLAKAIIVLDRIPPEYMKFISKSKTLAIKYYEYLERSINNLPLPAVALEELKAKSVEDLRFQIYQYKGGTEPRPPEPVPKKLRIKKTKAELAEEKRLKQMMTAQEWEDFLAQEEADRLQRGSPQVALASAREAEDQELNLKIAQMGAAELSDYSITTGRLISMNQFLDLDIGTRINYFVGLQQRGFWDDAPKFKTQVNDMLGNLASVDEKDVNNLYNEIKTVTGKGVGSKIHKKVTRNLIFGKGLATKKDFTDKIDFSEGIPKDKSYIPFGRYVLNKHRLNDNRLMIKTIKGGAISALPTLAISPDLSKIIKKMIGGGLPSYNEMNALNEDEQDILYKVFKLSNVDKSEMLPAPNKTKEEQEMNKFMILKGEIQAGNDNKEMIKDFKVMLMRFIHGGKIPKSQGMDIICELMVMGY
jgi:hypothetical protein